MCRVTARLQGSLDKSPGNPTSVSVDPSVIAALETAIAADPENPALRVHLASLLVMAGDPQRALEHARAALRHDPDHTEALVNARDAARALADHALAERYRRLLGAASEPIGTFDADRWVETDPADDETEEPFEIPEGFAAVAPPDTERPRVTLDDVGGQEGVKARLDAALLAPLRSAEARGGLLLYGPPGCGKTFIARAVAGELAANFLALPLQDTLSTWLGEAERRVHDAFAAAHRAAPCVLLLDDLDAVHPRVIDQLLAELDADHAGVFVLAATDHPWDVDPALRRPGRLDHAVLVVPPDPLARETIFRKALDGRPVRGVDPVELARRTDGCSGADIVHIVESAAALALQESVRTGAMHPITQPQLERAAAQTAPSTRAWFGLARSHARYANTGGQFDDLLAYLRSNKLP